MQSLLEQKLSIMGFASFRAHAESTLGEYSVLWSSCAAFPRKAMSTHCCTAPDSMDCKVYVQFGLHEICKHVWPHSCYPNLREQWCESKLPYTCWSPCHPQRSMLFWGGQLTKYWLCRPLVSDGLWYWSWKPTTRDTGPLRLRSQLWLPMVIACFDFWYVCAAQY